MATTIASNSIETVTELIRKDFENIDFSMDFIYGKADRLIKLAKDLSLFELAKDLEEIAHNEYKNI